MSMLDRYRKPGGFVQLLALIETSTQAKQDKFLEIVREEDARWAQAIKTKLLDMTRIYAWNDDTLALIWSTLHDLTIATAMHAMDDKGRARIQSFFPISRFRKIEGAYSEGKPTPAEIQTQHMKIIESVRKLSLEGNIRFEKFAPDLQIEDGVEEKLSRLAMPSDAAPAHQEPTANVLSFGDYDVPASSGGDSLEARIQEIQLLKKKLGEVSKENATLRHELSLAKTKLEQIRKIA